MQTEQGAETQHMSTGKHTFRYSHLFLSSKDQIQDKNHSSKGIIGHKYLNYLVIRMERVIKYLCENVLQRKPQKAMGKAYATGRERVTRNRLQLHFQNPLALLRTVS